MSLWNFNKWKVESNEIKSTNGGFYKACWGLKRDEDSQVCFQHGTIRMEIIVWERFRNFKEAHLSHDNYGLLQCLWTTLHGTNCTSKCEMNIMCYYICLHNYNAHILNFRQQPTGHREWPFFFYHRSLFFERVLKTEKNVADLPSAYAMSWCSLLKDESKEIFTEN